MMFSSIRIVMDDLPGARGLATASPDSPTDPTGSLAVRREPHSGHPGARSNSKGHATGLRLPGDDVVVPVAKWCRALPLRGEHRRPVSLGADQRDVGGRGAVVDG